MTEFFIKLSLHGQKSLIGVSAPKNLVALVNTYKVYKLQTGNFQGPQRIVKKVRARLSGRPKGTKKETRLVFTRSGLYEKPGGRSISVRPF